MVIEIPKVLPLQPLINIGIVGHVDHGKTTLTKLLSGKWTDTHSEEKKRGITIKLGYTNFIIYYNPVSGIFSTKAEDGFKPIEKVSIVDAPGHESFMATMISGAAVMDCALLVIAADQKCPQAQTIEHLKALEIAGISKIIVIQNKIDLVTREDAISNYKEIKAFLKGTIAQDSPIIPISAQHSVNFSKLLEMIVTNFKQKGSDHSFGGCACSNLMHVVRSFDVNKPGTDYTQVKGGVLGGAVVKGTFKVGDEIEIKPGLFVQKEGKGVFQTVFTKIIGLMSDRDSLKEAGVGGSIAVMTDLDPFVTRNDSLVGNIVGLKGSLPNPLLQVTFEPKLFKTVESSEGETLEVKDIVLGEPLMMIVNAMPTVGVASKANPREVTITLKKGVMAFKGDRVVIFKKFAGNKWKIAGYGLVKL